MNNKTKSAKGFSESSEAFRCPHCKGSLKVVDFKRLICINKHNFDFAKQGYVNLMTRSSNSHYDKSLFDARQKIIMDSELYAPLHQVISNVIKTQMNPSNFPFFILDAGCGEGSHLHKILNECKTPTLKGVGLDISKDGIISAAKKYNEPIWIVGDLANSPLADQSFHVVLNILSPSNYKEFKRIIVPDGLVIKVVPRTNYLKELRTALYGDTNRKTYKNDETVGLFKKHFDLKEVINVCYQRHMDHHELEHLVQMTPLSWSSNKADVESFINRVSKITVDLDILVGINKRLLDLEKLNNKNK
ncbi:putative RNA methyltransferase [Fredinandcohnia salidurans]|uniref:RNA methyltransferase n=1 Tax=Fredinandcohnia salidurans TaxID=2595041 RepID=A0ABW4MNH2_9BACI